mgnify:FL=1
MASLQEIRARLQAAEAKQGGQFSGTSDIYPHWNLDEGQSCTLRFLPDANKQNTFFWAERAMIRLPFAGIKGETESKQIMVQVPCMEMWAGETCPILAEVRPWFKDKSLEDMGRKYWKKRSYLFQGFVRKDPLNEEKTPENPIRRFIIGPQIYQIIKSALMDPELEEMPTDAMRGLDFTITKTSKGGFADYNTSKWSRKESALTADEQAAIEKYGLFDLGSFLPKKPGEVELKVIKEMFEASVDGQPYDTERWGQYYRPAGVAAPGGTNTAAGTDEDAEAAPSAKPAAQAAPANKPQADEPPFDADEPAAAAEPVRKPAANTGGGQSAQDILAMIRARQQKQS